MIALKGTCSPMLTASQGSHSTGKAGFARELRHSVARNGWQAACAPVSPCWRLRISEMILSRLRSCCAWSDRTCRWCPSSGAALASCIQAESCSHGNTAGRLRLHNEAVISKNTASA